MDLGFLREIRTFNQRFSNNPNEKFLLMILGSQAKLENDNKRINVKRGLKTRAEMAALFHDLPDALTATVEIAMRCAVRARTRKPILPNFSTVAGAEAAPKAEAKPEPVKAEAAKVEAKPEPVKSAPLKAEAARAEPMKTEAPVKEAVRKAEPHTASVVKHVPAAAAETETFDPAVNDARWLDAVRGALVSHETAREAVRANVEPPVLKTTLSPERAPMPAPPVVAPNKAGGIFHAVLTH